MLKISKWSILGYVVGFLFSLFSAWRYFIIYNDTDRAIVYVLIGLIICGLAFLYNEKLRINKILNNHIKENEKDIFITQTKMKDHGWIR